jgi:glutamyl-tRNA synthetase
MANRSDSLIIVPAENMTRLTRLAPSPTGALHLGNARTFLINWLLARQNNWRILLRIEDIDGPRIKREADLESMEDLRWLGLDWDMGPIYQTSRAILYRDAINKLVASGEAYACVCTRQEIETAASAPHADDGSTIYPGTCFGRFPSPEAARQVTGREPALRFRVNHEPVEFLDRVVGPLKFDPPRQLGDFVVAKADGTPAYQLAVVVDDADMGVTDIVRGDDLLDSTPRQILLYRALGLGDRVPEHYHVPLIVGTDGRRLAKRHGDTRLSYYRQRGVSPGRLLALLARWCGIPAVPTSLRPVDLLHSFRLEALPKQQIVFQPEDDAWLLSGKS